MTTLGKYCKAYPLARLREFAGWNERAENARSITKEVNGEKVTMARELTDADYVYLQINFTVTDGIFIDENIIFSDVTPEWIEFCRNVLAQDFSHNGEREVQEKDEPGD
jgi:hypothetical protein